MVFSAAIPAVLAALAIAPTAFSVVNYPNDFVDPAPILNFEYDNTTIPAQQTIIQWANSLAKMGPWAVTTKQHLPPSGDNHDYMSWKPYQWPNCTGNTTVLSVDEMFKTCQYFNQDGKLNPDARLINNIGDFDDMANAIMFNALAWGLTRSTAYSQRVISYISTWFLHPDTKMNPNLNYAQMAGGPDGQIGTHTGILDLKAMAKVASGVVLLREGHAEGWNSTIDSSLQEWVKEYISWITTNKLALEEKAAPNNHGSFYFSQLASLYVIANDSANAAATIKEYFSATYTNQIDANGNQPFEADRTRPYHYLTYNLAAIITNGRLGSYAGYNDWKDLKTSGNGTILKAAEYAMNYPYGNEQASELWPVIGAIAAIYGDSDDKYAQWLNNRSRGAYVDDASFLWNQPLSDTGNSRGSYITYAVAGGGTGTLSAGVRPTGGTSNSGVALTVSWALAVAFPLLACIF